VDDERKEPVLAGFAVFEDRFFSSGRHEPQCRPNRRTMLESGDAQFLSPRSNCCF
jgi:hypothetical protein